jgi:hypothetical protein
MILNMVLSPMEDRIASFFVFFHQKNDFFRNISLL